MKSKRARKQPKKSLASKKVRSASRAAKKTAAKESSRVTRRRIKADKAKLEPKKCMSSVEEEDIIKRSNEAQNEINSFETCTDNSFFYTNDKFIESLDYSDILAAMSKKYPALNVSSSDALVQQGLIELLHDSPYMHSLLSKYNLTIFDFFKILYKYFGGIFKGAFLKKVKKELDGKSYVDTSRRPKL